MKRNKRTGNLLQVKAFIDANLKKELEQLAKEENTSISKAITKLIEERMQIHRMMKRHEDFVNAAYGDEE